ncbi:MAG: tetratricopeptide repeat protein, partial [Acidobacteria bacterium]|nr:tetratricopeptide repeat protein [Acidobacteriota bacterium]
MRYTDKMLPIRMAHSLGPIFPNVVIASLFLIAGLSINVFPQRNSAAAQNAFDQGNALYERGDEESLSQALTKFGDAYELYSKSQNKSYMALVRVFLGKTWKKLGDPVQALANYKDAAKLYTEVGNKAGQAAMLNNIGALLRDNGEYPEATNFYRQAIALLGTSGSPTDQARAYSGLADCFRFTGNLNEAVSNYQRSLTIWKTLTNNDDKVRANYGIALAYFALGDGQNSVRYGNEALQLARQMDEPSIVVEVLESLAQIYDDAGQKESAVKYRLDALNAYKNARGRVSEYAFETVVNNLADVYYRMGDLKSASRYLTENIKPGVRGNEYPAQTYLVGTLGEVLTAQGNYSRAIEVLNRGIELAQQGNDKHSEAYNYASLGIAYIGITNDPQSYSKAKSAFDKALGFFDRGLNPAVEGKALAGLIVVNALTGQKDQSLQRISDAESRGLTAGRSIPTIQILHAIGIANAIFGQHAAALPYLEKAYSLAQKRNNSIEASGIVSSLALSYQQTNDLPKAADFFGRS